VTNALENRHDLKFRKNHNLLKMQKHNHKTRSRMGAQTDRCTDKHTKDDHKTRCLITVSSDTICDKVTHRPFLFSHVSLMFR